MLKFLVVCAYSAVAWQIVVAELEGQTERPWHTTVQPAQDTLFHSNFFPARPNQRYDSPANETDTTYSMSTEKGNKILVTFYFMQLGDQYSCRRSRIQVFSANETENKYLCGEAITEHQILSDGHEFKFNFYRSKYLSNRGFLASWKPVPSDYQIKTPQQNGLYQVSYPTTLIRDQQEQVCVDLLNQFDSAQVTLDVLQFNDAAQANSSFENLVAEPSYSQQIDGRHCISLTVKTDESGDKASASDLALLKVTIKDGAKYDVTAFRLVSIKDKGEMSLVQTDRGKYKAGNTVHFRILSLSDDLKIKGRTLSKVQVLDPSFRTLHQWRNVSLAEGMVQKEFELFEGAPLGTYIIQLYEEKNGHESKISTTNFKVEEYVLPRFEVNIIPPTSIVKGEESSEWKVCAKYTHGAVVKGKVQAYFWSPRQYSWRRVKPPIYVNKTATTENDCAIFQLSADDLETMKSKEKNRVNLDVTFIEDGTDETQTASFAPNGNNLVDNEIKIHFADSSKRFNIGGFPYTGKIQVEDYDGVGIVDEELSVCVRLYRDIDKFREHFSNVWSKNEEDLIEAAKLVLRLNHTDKCFQATTDSAGGVDFAVPLHSIPTDVKKLSIKVTAHNRTPNQTSEDPSEREKNKAPQAVLDIELSHSNDLALFINSKKDEVLKCNEQSSVTFFISGEKGKTYKIQYFIISGGKEVSGETFDVSMDEETDRPKLVTPSHKIFNLKPDDSADTHIKKVDVTLDVDFRSSPTFQFLLMATDGNSTQLDSHTFNVEFCTEHIVNLELNTNKVQPNQDVTLHVKAEPGALCGVSLVDKSVDLLGNPNKVNQKRISELVKSSRPYSYSPHPLRYVHCDQLKTLADTGRSFMTNIPLFTNCKTLVEKGDDDEEESIYANKIGSPQPVLASVAFDAAPPGGGLRGGAGSTLSQPKTVVRTEFPETWLFDMEVLPEGSMDRALKAPGTITSWTAEAVCMSKQKGLGLGGPEKLLVTQDFFSDLRMPYSVKRGEEFPLNISVFNNLDTSLPLVLNVEGGEEVRVEGAARQSLCLAGRDNLLLSIPSTAMQVGDLNMSITLEIDNHQGCDTVEQGVGYSDRLIRPLKVKAEGLPVQLIKSDLKCINSHGDTSATDAPGGRITEQFDVGRPEGIVDGSESVWFYVSGDVMAGSLDNIGDLVRLPTGCGEQNMVKMAPNVYMIDYLNHNPKADTNGDYRAKAKRFMEIGYNRQQTYRHQHGAYSIWGPREIPDQTAGSTWLTAFVVKVFSQAHDSLTVDEKKLRASVDWIFKAQKENGCFEQKGYVHSSYLQGGGGASSISAFVTTALVEAHSSFEEVVPRAKLDSAVMCLTKSMNKTDLYTYSLATHALALYRNRTSRTDEELDTTLNEMVDYLMEKANTSQSGVRFWDQVTTTSNYYWSYSRSSAVEMTAYNIMTLILMNRLNDVVDSVKWLARQKNSQGGFVSTQDTVVALEALALYGSHISKQPTNLKGEMRTDGEERREISIEEDSKQVQQIVRFDGVPEAVSLELQGTGCVLAQSVLRYNLPEKEDVKAFSLKASASENGITVCVAYTGPREKTGMVLLEVEMPSGFKSVNPEYLINEIDYGVERVEEDEKENVVVLYFDEMGTEERCIPLKLKQEFEVKKRQPSRLSVYDYYKEDERMDTTYSLASRKV